MSPAGSRVHVPHDREVERATSQVAIAEGDPMRRGLAAAPV